MVVWLHEFPCIQASTVSFGEEPEDPENKKKKKKKGRPAALKSPHLTSLRGTHRVVRDLYH